MKNIKSYNIFINESVKIDDKIKGILKKIEYGDDIYYYVESDNMNIRLSNNFLNNTDEKVLDGFLDKENEWEIIEWNYRSDNPEEKYRVNGIIK